jgi:hypothetical protein
VGDAHIGKFDSQSVPMIAIGHFSYPNGLQFYNPVNNTFYPSLIINLQFHETSGSRFGLCYQPGTFIYR